MEQINDGPSFSQRIGIKQINLELQRDSMDDRLKNGLWNCIYMFYFFEVYKIVSSGDPRTTLLTRVWIDFYGNKLDERPQLQDLVKFIKINFDKSDFHEVYDLIEFLQKNFESRTSESMEKNDDFRKACNIQLQKNLSAYRFVNSEIAPITAIEEIESVEMVLKLNSRFKGAKTHIESALKYFSNREAPDYRNLIKESISAVESFCRVVTNNNDVTLGDALKEIGKTYTIHKALINAYNSLYGYTSDKDGIRHAMTEDPDLKAEDAWFLMVSCSAFINYLSIKVDA